MQLTGASSVLHRHPRLRLLLLLAAPMLVLVVVYLGALAVLLLSSFWSTDVFTGNTVKSFTLDNFRDVVNSSTYRTVIVRTVLVAMAVTVICALLAFPMAFYMAKVASPRARRLLVVAVLTPLWASYLVKAYCWRVIFDPAAGVMKQTLGFSPGFGITAAIIVLAYLWLPYMALPIYAGLEKLPNSLLDASGDLGARAGRTFWSVVLPMLKPSILAGAIFTFSLSLGDYITVQIVGGKSQLVGNLVYANIGAANNLPFAAAVATIPVVIMVIYLIAVRRTGALEEL